MKPDCSFLNGDFTYEELHLRAYERGWLHAYHKRPYKNPYEYVIFNEQYDLGYNDALMEEYNYDGVPE